MNHTRYFIWISALLFSTHLIGGNDRGGGGIALLCESDGKMTVELLDSYEREKTFGKLVTFEIEKLSPTEIVDRILSHYLEYDKERMFRYKEINKSLMHKVEWTGELPSTEDYGYIDPPKFCKVVQVAIQMRPWADSVKTIQINRAIWNQFDSLQKAALILHEIVYLELMEKFQLNSIRLRSFVAWLIQYSNLEVLPAAYQVARENSGLKNNSGECTPMWSQNVLRADICRGIQTRLDIAKFVTSPCEGPIVFGLTRYSGPSPDLLTRKSHNLRVQYNTEGKSILWLNAYSKEDMSTVDLILNVRACK